jgi:[ribosomal protein S18]-alanine N-acetyltransferase
MTEQRAARLLSDDRVLASFLARRGTNPVGLSTVWRDDAGDRPSAEIVTLAVVPHAQGQGLGRALLRRALAAAVGAGLYSASLSTSSVNEPALGLYTSEGFEVVEKRVCWGRNLSEGSSHH